MQPIVSGYIGVQSPLDGGRAAVLSPPSQMSPQPVSSPSGGSSASTMACGGAFSSDRSTRVTHMANGALMTRTLHMAPTSSVRGLHAGHGRRHATMNPYPHAHLRGAETSCSNASGGPRRLQTGQQMVSVYFANDATFSSTHVRFVQEALPPPRPPLRPRGLNGHYLGHHTILFPLRCSITHHSFKTQLKALELV